MQFTNKLVVSLCLLFFCCNNNSSNKNVQQDEKLDQYKDNCAIPNEILNYISSHSLDFELLDIDQDLKTIEEYIKPDKCPIICMGDFNQNGKEDFAIILKYKGYKELGFENHIFPFLVVFNDYKDEVIPTIVYKTGEYKDDPIKTIVYEQRMGEEEILTYIEKRVAYGRDFINVTYPEKSSLFIYWNKENSQYELIWEEESENPYEILNSKHTPKGSWYIDCLHNEPELMIVDIDSPVLTISINQYYLKFKKLSVNTEDIISYKLERAEGLADIGYNIDQNNYNDESVVEIKVLSENKIEFKWLGIYNKLTNKREYIENPFNSKNNTVELIKCEDK